jgi:transposase/DNA-directed RNA polymerase specialized sigma24 family protein
VDQRSGDETRPSSEIQEWEQEKLEIKKVAARFPERYAEDLRAELAVTLLALKRRRHSGIRNWKAYLVTALRHRALTLVNKWRAQEGRERSSDDPFAETPEPSPGLEGADSEQLENHLTLSELRSKVDVESYGILMLWAASKGNRSRVAQLLGKHRNTIRHRLETIWRTLRECPIENVSGRFVPIQRRSSATVQLTAAQWEQLACLAQDSRFRDAFKGRLILALALGQSYAQIERRLKTTAPTISRWKHRFEKHGIEGLKTRHQGRRSQMNAPSFPVKWLRAIQRMRLLKRPVSCRKIAQELGIGRSTAHRFLKAGRA